MGVPKYYRWVSERYPALSQIVSDSQIPVFDNLYLDMNGIIHNCSHPNDDDVTFRITEEQIMIDIFAYIDRLFKMIKPERVFFMAIDGVAPRAKMNQQRARRFMSARTAAEQMDAAKKKGEEIPDEKRFDSNCITPGTPFMATLHKQLDEWVKHKVDTDPLWQNNGQLRVILSGHDCPGEGEHKIMDFIRAERVREGYDSNTRHCMYGLDADLIMLGMCSHEPHFSLLREEVKFSRPAKPSKSGSGKPKKVEVKKPDHSDVKFHLLHLQLFREYLCKEFETLKESLSFDYDVESIIDDWVLMGFLIGNDFIPHLPHVHIHDDALPLLYDTYKQVLPTLDGYLNEKGVLNLKRFELFLKAVARNDKKCFMDSMEDEEYLQKKMGRPAASLDTAGGVMEVVEEELVTFEDSDMSSSTSDSDEEDEEDEESTSDPAFVSSDEEDEAASVKSSSSSDGIMSAEAALAELDLNDPIEDEFSENLKLMQFKEMDDKEFENNVDKCWSVPVSNAFKRHKKRYYSDKMKFGNISKEELRKQAEGYVRAIQWNLHYYYHGCISWNWFFPFHYAPYISDVIDFANMDFNFEMSVPFRPFEQLLAVLPAASADCLPPVLRELMTDPESPIADFYPTNFETDLNGKKNDWEAVVLIPFINQEKLLKAIQEKEHRLSNEEKARNTHGSHIMYTANMEKESGERSVREPIDKDKFRIDISAVVHGLLPGVKQDVFFPGFPTMMHLPHTSELKELSVKVFHMPSRKPSMKLTVGKREEFDKDNMEVARDIIDKEVYVDWPILTLAKVGEIWTEKERYYLEKGEVKMDVLEDEYQRHFKKLALDNRDKQISRYAIDTGEITRIAFVRRFLGCTYAVEDGVLRSVKQWGSTEVSQMIPVPLQLVVTNVNVEENRKLADLPLAEAFPSGAKVFVMTPQWSGFGHPALVQDIQNPGTAECRVVVKANLYPGPELDVLKDNIHKFNLHWFNNFEAGKRSGIDRHLLSRLTGTVYLCEVSREEYEGNPGKSYPKLNIGLGLKLTKQNKEVPDYTRRVKETGYWEFSLLAVQLVTEYRNKFRDLFGYLERSHDANDMYFATDVWPNESRRNENLNKLKDYLSEVPTASIEKIEGSSEYVDSQVIANLERLLTPFAVNDTPKRVKCHVNPAVIYRPALSDGRVCPDPEADFLLLDRVTYTVEGGPVPCGLQGTVIGIMSDKVDVLFDRPFKGGYKIRGALSQGYHVPKASLVNVTFGKERKWNQEQGSSKPTSRATAGSEAKGRNNRNGKFGGKQEVTSGKDQKNAWKQRNQGSAQKEPMETTSGPFVEWKPKQKVNVQKEEEVPKALQLLTRAQNKPKGGESVEKRENTQKEKKKEEVKKTVPKQKETSAEKSLEAELSAMLQLNKNVVEEEAVVAKHPSKAEDVTESSEFKELLNEAQMTLLLKKQKRSTPPPHPEQSTTAVQGDSPNENMPSALGVLFNSVKVADSSSKDTTSNPPTEDNKMWFTRSNSNKTESGTNETTDEKKTDDHHRPQRALRGVQTRGGRGRGGRGGAPSLFHGPPIPPPPGMIMMRGGGPPPFRGGPMIAQRGHHQQQSHHGMPNMHNQGQSSGAFNGHGRPGLPPPMNGHFFGNSRSHPHGPPHPHPPNGGYGNDWNRRQHNQQQQQPKINVNVTDLKPSTISRPRRSTDHHRSSNRRIGVTQMTNEEKTSEECAKQVFDTLGVNTADLQPSTEQLHSPRGNAAARKQRKPRLAANFGN